jgi:hypothetical protein
MRGTPTACPAFSLADLSHSVSFLRQAQRKGQAPPVQTKAGLSGADQLIAGRPTRDDVARLLLSLCERAGWSADALGSFL